MIFSQTAPVTGPSARLRFEVLDRLPDLANHDWLLLSGGRSNLVWRVGALVVKAFDAGAQSPLFPNDPAAEARALRLCAPLNLAPALRAQGAGWIAYDHVAGPVWSTDVASVARILNRVHRTPVLADSFRNLPMSGDGLIAAAISMTADCLGDLPPPPPNPGISFQASRSLLHGDAVPGNIIESAKSLILIDWQCPALGDPIEDIAAFLSPAMQWLYRGAVLTKAETADFLLAYPDAATVARYRAYAPILHWRMAAHCLWKAARGAADYARAAELELASIGSLAR